MQTLSGCDETALVQLDFLPFMLAWAVPDIPAHVIGGIAGLTGKSGVFQQISIRLSVQYQLSPVMGVMERPAPQRRPFVIFLGGFPDGFEGPAAAEIDFEAVPVIIAECFFGDRQGHIPALSRFFRRADRTGIPGNARGRRSLFGGMFAIRQNAIGIDRELEILRRRCPRFQEDLQLGIVKYFRRIRLVGDRLDFIHERLFAGNPEDKGIRSFLHFHRSLDFVFHPAVWTHEHGFAGTDLPIHQRKPGGSEFSASFQQFSEEFLPDEADPLTVFAGSDFLRLVEKLIVFRHFRGRIDFIPQFDLAGDLELDPQSGIFPGPQEIVVPQFFQIVVEPPHQRRGLAEHQREMFVQQRRRIGLLIPGQFGKYIQIQVGKHEVIGKFIYVGTRITMFPDGEILSDVIVFQRRDESDISIHGFSGPGSEQDSAFSNFQPRCDLRFGLRHAGMIRRGDPRKNGHGYLNIVRNLAFRRQIVRYIGELDQLARDPFLFHPVGQVGGELPDVIADFLLFLAVLVNRHSARRGDFSAFFTAAPVQPVLWTDCHITRTERIDIPVFHAAAGCGFPGQIRLDILIDLFPDPAFEAQLPRKLKFRIGETLPVFHQRKIFRMRFREPFQKMKTV